MTVSQWLALISAAAPSFEWELNSWGRIRTVDGRCPICAALYWVSDGQINHKVAAGEACVEANVKEVGESELLVITRAADFQGKQLTIARQMLLHAVGFASLNRPSSKS